MDLLLRSRLVYGLLQNKGDGKAGRFAKLPEEACGGFIARRAAIAPYHRNLTGIYVSKGVNAMCDADALLKTVVAEAKALGIPVASGILPKVWINNRAQTRFGRCVILPDGSCQIELAGRVAAAGECACKTVLAHEILHSCKGCRNHQARWKGYAQRMNAAYGYDIRRTHSPEALGVLNDKPCRYRLECRRCRAVLTRMKKSPLVQHPERYRCRCGGPLLRL